MRYKIGKNPVYRAPIPALIGGINTAASSDIVGDNQLSNCLNMMAMDGILRTRPGFVLKDDDGGSGIEFLQSTAKNIKKYDFTIEHERYYGTGSGEDVEGGIKVEKEYGKMISVWGNDGIISFLHCRKDGSLVDAGGIDTKGDIINEFTVTGNDGLYCFVTADVAGNKTYNIYLNKGEEWKEVKSKKESDDEEEIYIPTIMTNCRSNGEVYGILGGDYLSGINLLSNRYKIEVTAFNETLLRRWHEAVYKLPHKPPVGSEIKVDVVKANGETETHSLVVTANEDGSVKSWVIEPKTEDMEFAIALTDGVRIIFYKTLKDDGVPLGIASVTDDTEWINQDDTITDKAAEKAKYIVLPGQNNITITAEYEPNVEDKKRIFSATCAAWYGGNQGLASGTRLFIGGMEGIYKNVLQWSDLSNPLYFPENCNAEVGDPSQGITAFGKQADMLVVFKPFEIYGASYLLQDAPVEDAAYDFISDLTVTTAVFPLTQISNEIGCDCPDSIQLCRNRLCWAHSNGKVYTLVNSSQYNEKNIYELTDPIRRALPNISPHLLKRATSTDWEGYYVLSVGEHIFLMQYESYGYSRIYSYTSEEAASHKLPWFYLRTPFIPRAVMNLDNQLITVSSPNNGAIVLHRADRDSVKDDIVIFDGGIITVSPVQIPSMVQSKIFDFSRPEIKKVICHILAEVGGTSGNSIKLSAVTDRSRYCSTVGAPENSPINQDDEFTLEGSSIFTPMPEAIERTVMRINGSEATPVDIKRINSSASGFFRMVRVNPGIFGARKFAVRLESEGAFSLGQVCIEYKMLGSVN